MNKIRFGAKALVAIAIIGAIMFVAPTLGRFSPSHLILQDVYCGSCHPEQVSELGSSGAHLAHFTNQINASVAGLTGEGTSAAMAITGGCTMCHNYWDNMEWFGVDNLKLQTYDTVQPTPITDIYGNVVSPYGLSSTQQFLFNISGGIYNVSFNGKTKTGVEPWGGGLDVFYYEDALGTHTRVDYLWSQLSAISPGPANFLNGVYKPGTSGQSLGCGTAEKGLCHIAANSVALSEAGFRPEFLAQNITAQPGNTSYNGATNVNNPNVTGQPGAEAQGSNNSISLTPIQNLPGSATGSGVFFRHEMAYTTAQYAAKPVKLCGACHVFKLPPMTWGGEPWSSAVISVASKDPTFADLGLPKANGANDISGYAATVAADPFGLVPLYPTIGSAQLIYAGHLNTTTGQTPYTNFSVAFKTPDWAHANVPCVRCHVHAGVNGVTVTDENSPGPINKP